MQIVSESSVHDIKRLNSGITRAMAKAAEIGVMEPDGVSLQDIECSAAGVDDIDEETSPQSGDLGLRQMTIFDVGSATCL